MSRALVAASPASRRRTSSEGVVQYEPVADHPGDRTYGNFVRYYIRNGFEDPFEGA